MLAPKWARHVGFVLELVIGIGLILLWVSYMLMNIQIHQLAGDHPKEPRLVMKIPGYVQSIFITGDALFTASGVAILFRLDDTVTESMKLRYTSLLAGLVASIHLPIFIRAWIFKAYDSGLVVDDASVDGVLESTQLMGSAVATAFCTSICVILTLTALWGVDFFPSLRYSESLQRYSKLSLIGSVVAFEFFFISSLVEFQSQRTVISGIVLLCLSLILGLAGYVPARYLSLFQDELEEEIPFFAL